MQFIDSHCHLDIILKKDKNISIDKIIFDAKNKNINLLLNVSTTLNYFEEIFNNFSSKYNILFSCGIHPLNSKKEKFNINKFYKILKLKKVIAIGETGLDYYYCNDNINQQKLFIKHILLSKNFKKPLIIHNRNSDDDLLSIIKSENIKDVGGVLHSFNSNLSFVSKILDENLYISFSGILTFKSSGYLREVLKFIPINRILIETDSPFLTPEPYRGKINTPDKIIEVAKIICKIKNISLEEVSYITTNNFYKLFKINI